MRAALPFSLLLMLFSPGCSEDGSGPGTDAGADSSLRGDARAPVIDAGPDVAPSRDSSDADDAARPAPDAIAVPGTFEQVANFGANPGNLEMFKFAPGSPRPGAALVVVLHSCDLDAATFRRFGGWGDLADRRGFYVLFPQQKAVNNGALCFNWFDRGDQQRDGGEALSIKQMVDAMLAAHDIDADKVFVTGMSAGGAMATVMLATYPDVFAGGAILAGIPYGCASGYFSAFTCMAGQTDSAENWAAQVLAAYSSYNGPYPRVAIFHGGADPVVSDTNMTELMKQWTAVHGADQSADATVRVGQADKAEYRNANGDAVVITFHLPSMGHAVPIDPGTGPSQGGESNDVFVDADLFSAAVSADFWGI